MQCGLSVKLMGYVMAGVLITSAVIGVMRVQNERGPLGEMVDKAGQSMANATAAGAAALVAGYDYGNLEILAGNVARQADVVRVAISNEAGRAMTEAAGRMDGSYRRFEAPVVFQGRTIGNVVVDLSTTALDQALSALYWRVFVEQLIFGAILGLIVYLFTASGIVAPVRRLTTVIEEAVGNGDSFAPRKLEVDSDDEIGRLVSVFNALNASLASYHERLHGKIDLANEELRAKNLELGGRTRELEHALEMLNVMATTDWLTELPNRRKFDENMSRMFHQSARFDEDVTLVLLDIDRFKRINDRYGHNAGDQVLRELGAILQKSARKADMPARLGGDEFGLILYHTDAAEAESFVRKLVAGIRAHPFCYEGATLEISLSVGIAQYEHSMGSPQALYFAADKALYWAKNSGRDRHCVYSGALGQLH